jgi:ornithine--oxo-acid transaminase
MVAGLATLEELDRAGLVARTAGLGERLLELTKPLRERYDVVKDVRGLGLIWAIEFGEPAGGSRSWRALERRQAGIFSQFVVGPLFHRHHILSQVAGHDLNVIKALPPLTVDEADLERFAEALDDSIGQATPITWAAIRFAAGAGLRSIA